MLSFSILQLEMEAWVTRHMSGRAGLTHSGKCGSRSPVSELFTVIAPGLLVLSMELTHFWQAAQDLQDLTILGCSSDWLKHLSHSTVEQSAKRLISQCETLPKCMKRPRRKPNSVLSAGLQKAQVKTKINMQQSKKDSGKPCPLTGALPKSLGGLEALMMWICLYSILILRLRVPWREN